MGGSCGLGELALLAVPRTQCSFNTWSGLIASPKNAPRSLDRLRQRWNALLAPALLLGKHRRTALMGPPLLIDVDPSGLVWSGLRVSSDLGLLSALALEEHDLFSVVGVTVVAGSAPLKDTEVNARKLLCLAGIEKPLSSGISWHDQQVSWPMCSN
jgi:hypothetical protein